MTTITLEAITERQTELAMMIEQLRTRGAPIIQIVAEQAIELQHGEHYAGAVLDDHGVVKHHLVLMAPRPHKRLNWQDAMDWAKSVGGSLPDRQEQALLYANCKPHLEQAWYWSCVEHEDDASFAWGCDFSDGLQYSNHKSFQGCAIAVRRISLIA